VGVGRTPATRATSHRRVEGLPDRCGRPGFLTFWVRNDDHIQETKEPAVKQQQILKRTTRTAAAGVDLRTPSGRSLPF